MTVDNVRKKIAMQIVIFNMVLIASLVVYYIVQGFDSKEFIATFTLITSVSAVYFGIVFQKIGLMIKEVLQGGVEKKVIENDIALPKILTWLIPLHFVALFSTVSLKSFTVITFQDMNMFLAAIEGLFGIYMGNILANLFELNQEK